MEVKNQIKDDSFNFSFNSTEFDGFLSKVDAEVRKNNIKNGQNKILKCDSKFGKKEENIKELCVRQSPYKNKGHFYNMPLSFDDLSEKDFQDSFQPVEKISSENLIYHNSIKKNEIWSMKNGFKSCLSPINGKFVSNGQSHSFSSTPIKKDEKYDNSPKNITKGGVTSNNKEAVFTKADYELFDADLFEDWEKDDICPDASKEKSLITLSQALKLIEESEKVRELEESNKVDLNQSVDLLTGKIVCPKVNETINLLEDSFNLTEFESAEKKIKNNLLVEKKEIKNCENITVDDQLIDSKENKLKNKPSAAQKLNFEGTQKDLLICEKIENEKGKNSVNFDLFIDSDDSFDMITQGHVIDDCKKHISGGPSSINCLKTDSDCQPLSNHFSDKKNFSVAKENLSDELSDDSIIVIKKKGKLCKINESDSEEDICGSEFLRPKKSKTKKWNKNSEDSIGREFIESEAEVSDTGDVSSDETEPEDDKLEASFLDESSYFTQNTSTDMTAKYLESVKAVNNHPGTFKIPVPKPYDPVTIFSQFQPDTSADYEIDSFCVNDLPDEEEEEDSQIKVLEIAEEVLEKDRKKRKKKHRLYSRKIKRI